MLARVLVLQEKEENVFNILESLPDCEIVPVDTVDKALIALKRDDFDLIISAVHLEHDGSVFDFLKSVKGSPETRRIPFVFYCARTSTFARSVRHGLQIAARSLGAEKYITMERFERLLLRNEFLSLLGHILENVSEDQLPVGSPGPDTGMHR